ncbi:IS3 family transposase [Pediococcus cellicola]|uniref:IS3 family transposase n=1 Tax=Pediococcus cellicola TaxID=319652 RepID=UPI00360F47E8
MLKVGTVYNNCGSYESFKLGVTNYLKYYNKKSRTKLVRKALIQYRNLFDRPTT